MPPVDHVLLTRFNLPSAGVESLVRAQEGWLRTRVALFERYCVPSVEAQRNRDFTWLIYFDPESPEWLLDKIEGWRDAGTFVPVLRESVSHEELVSDLRALFPEPSSELITTNLDNDDGLAVGFVDRVQAVETDGGRTAIFLTHGLIKNPAGVYRRVDRHNAFCSVREPWDDPGTCWAAWHNLLHRQMPVQEVGGAAAWLQVVHGTNVSNRVHGTLTDATGFTGMFPGLLDDVRPAGTAALLHDRFVAVPFRVSRDLLRSGVKAPAKALLGDEGFERGKRMLGRVRGAVRGAVGHGALRCR